jgi:hypothetical protein
MPFIPHLAPATLQPKVIASLNLCPFDLDKMKAENYLSKMSICYNFVMYFTIVNLLRRYANMLVWNSLHFIKLLHCFVDVIVIVHASML